MVFVSEALGGQRGLDEITAAVQDPCLPMLTMTPPAAVKLLRSNSYAQGLHL